MKGRAREMPPKLLDLCHIAPPRGSAPPTSLRLLFFDLLWLAYPFFTKRLFLYRVPNASTFLETHLPNLKRSLSLALSRFYPLAGRLIQDGTAAPYLRYADGDSVTLAVAEYDDDLEELASHRPRYARRFDPLLPDLPKSGEERPVLALQVTLFPDQGIAVGVTVAHVAVDGCSFLHFLRTWASICKSGGDGGAVAEELPFYDRNVVWDSEPMRESILSMIKGPDRRVLGWKGDRSELVRATFTVTAAELEKLRTWVAFKRHGSRRCSSFTLAIALAWTCLLKAGETSPQEKEALLFPVNCRSRLFPPIPASYFGNCVSLLGVEEEKGRLVGEDGLVAAAAGITEALRELEHISGRMEGTFDEAHRIGPTKPLTVAGSPRFGTYKVDFGWGRPAKCEMVHVEGGRTVSIAENGDDEEGGLEIGLALPSPYMEDFATLFAATLKGVSDCVLALTAK